MANNSEIPPGQTLTLTPSKLNKTNSQQSSYKYKRKNTEMDSDSDIDLLLYSQLKKEQENNEYLKKELSEMRNQLCELTKTISNLNETINKLQNHNTKLYKTMQKSEKKTKKPNEKDKTKDNTTTLQHIQISPTEAVDKYEMSHHTTPNGTKIPPKTNEKEHDDSLQDINMSTSHSVTEITDSESSEDENANNDNTNEEEEKNQKDTTNTFKENEKIQRNNKIPPIDIWTESQQATQILIRHHMPKYSCIFNKINKTKMRITPKTTEVRNQLLTLLTNRKIEYNTYTPSDNKMQNILLKRTEISNAQIIKHTLEKHGIQPHNIQKFETGYMRKNNITSNIWQITLQPKTDINTILNIRYVEQWSVKWEMMKKPLITQCRRCQRFNHSASNCTLPFRCVKCTNDHKPGECPLDASDNKTKPTCVNCKGEHTANNARICAAFKRQLEIKEQKKKGKTQTTRTTDNSTRTHTIQQNINTNKTTNTNTNYAKIVKNAQNEQPISNGNAISKRSNNNTNADNKHPIQQLIEMNQQSMREMMNTFMNRRNEIMNALLNNNNGSK